MPTGWQAIIVNRNGVAVQYVQPRNLKLRQRLNGHMVATCTVDLREGDTSELMVGSRGLRLLRAGELAFQGPIVSPLRYTASPRLSNVEVTAWSPLGVLTRRFLHASELASASFTNTDAGAIAEALLDIANAQEQTHLRIGDVDTSVNRDRTYELGKQIGEAIDQLAYVLNGYFYKDRPVSGEGAVWAALDILYPDPGVDRPGALFSFGAGTRDSVNEFSVEYNLPTNDVVAIGAINETTQQPISAEADDPTSVGEYGMWGSVVSYTDVSVQSTLDDHADEAVDADPPVIYNVKPLPTSITESGRAPRLGEDFDVGDTVRLTLRANAPYDVSGAVARVNDITIAVSDDAEVEYIEQIAFEVMGS